MKTVDRRTKQVRRPLRVAGFPLATCRLLLRHGGIATVADLLCRTSEEVGALKGVGYQTLLSISSRLSKLGYEWHVPPPPPEPVKPPKPPKPCITARTLEVAYAHYRLAQEGPDVLAIFREASRKEAEPVCTAPRLEDDDSYLELQYATLGLYSARMPSVSNGRVSRRVTARLQFEAEQNEGADQFEQYIQ